MSTIFLVEHEEFGTFYALKVLKEDLSQNESAKSRFLREIKNCQRLRHDHIVQIIDGGQRNSTCFMLLEYLERGNLQELLDTVGRIPWPLAITFAIDLCQGLEYIHYQGIVHRDLKPSNLLFSSNGAMKLTDFGISKWYEGTAMTQEGEIIGTPAYMAPEQVYGKEVTPLADLFAMGTVLYEMLTGYNPFEDEKIHVTATRILHFTPPALNEIDSVIPVALRDLIQELHCKEPSGRPLSVAEVRKRLVQILDEEGVRVKRSVVEHFLLKPHAIKYEFERLIAERIVTSLKTRNPPPPNVPLPVGYQHACYLLDAMRYNPGMDELFSLLENYLDLWDMSFPSKVIPALSQHLILYEENPTKTLLLSIVRLQEEAGNTIEVIRFLGRLRAENPDDLTVQEKIRVSVEQVKDQLREQFGLSGPAYEDPAMSLQSKRLSPTRVSAIRQATLRRSNLETLDPRTKQGKVRLVVVFAVGLAAGMFVSVTLTQLRSSGWLQVLAYRETEISSGVNLKEIDARLNLMVKSDGVRIAYLKLLVEASNQRDWPLFANRLDEFLVLFPDEADLRQSSKTVKGLSYREQMEVLRPVVLYTLEKHTKSGHTQ